MSLDCPLERIDVGLWECPYCGWTYRGRIAPKRNCPRARDRFIAEIDRLLDMPETPEINAEIDAMADRLICLERRRARRGGCNKRK